MSSIQSKTAQKPIWDDTSKEEKACKKKLIITFIATSVILSLALAVGIYWCATSQAFVNPHATLSDPAVWMMMPNVLAGFLLIGSVSALAGAILWKKEDKRSLEQAVADLLSADTLDVGYQKFYQKIGSLIKHQLLTIENATTMQQILEDYHHIRPKMLLFDQMKPDVQTFLTQEINSKNYSDMKTKREGLRNQWEALHKSLIPKKES